MYLARYFIANGTEILYLDATRAVLVPLFHELGFPGFEKHNAISGLPRVGTVAWLSPLRHLKYAHCGFLDFLSLTDAV